MPLTSLWKQVYGYLCHRGASHHDAQDWTQDVFAQLSAKGILADERIPLDVPMLCTAYLRTMARNRMTDDYRKRNAFKRQHPLAHAKPSGEEAATLSTPDVELMSQETMQAWESQLDRLNQEISQGKKRDLFDKVRPYLLVGTRSENLTKLSKETEISLSTVKVQIFRWRQCLIQRMREEFGLETRSRTKTASPQIERRTPSRSGVMVLSG